MEASTTKAGHLASCGLPQLVQFAAHMARESFGALPEMACAHEKIMTYDRATEVYTGFARIY